MPNGTVEWSKFWLVTHLGTQARSGAHKTVFFDLEHDETATNQQLDNDNDNHNEA